jgi:P-type Cu2+ transporter
MRSVKACFHCGETIPDGASVVAQLGDRNQPVCCPGCKAVAEFIHSSGLDAYYQHRDTPGAEHGLRADSSEWTLYDSEDLLARYVHEDEKYAEATIDIGGMYCSACVWLLDKALNRLAAVESITVNPSAHRAVIQWDRTKLTFSELLGAISQVGFTPSPTGAGLAGGEHDGEYRLALRRLIVAAAAGMQVMMFAIALYAGAHYGIEGRIEQFLRVTSLLVSLPVVFYSAVPFYAGAYRGIRAGSAGMDLPVAIAISAAFAASAYATLVNAGDIYFDSVAMFVLFLSGTRYLEMRVRHRSENSTQALARLLPETVTRVRDGAQQIIVLDKLRAGEVVLIRPGDVIPADGVVLSGDLAIDESLLTGESVPVTRTKGMELYAGGINRAGSASVEITLTGASTSLAEIGRLLERAKADRPPIAMLADRVASKFVIAVLLVASLTGMVWLTIDPTRTFEIVLATLVVTCPCALSLATPAALAAATSRLARDGFLLVRSRILEVVAGRVMFVFDKTGTLTEGRPRVTKTLLLAARELHDEDYYLALAAEIETVSEHVLARAFSAHFKAGTFQSGELRVLQGCGVEAVVDGTKYRVGNSRYVAELSDVAEPDELDQEEFTIVYLGDEKEMLAKFVIGDELRADAKLAVTDLKNLGHHVAIASGDRESVVATVAAALDIEEWHAGLTPAAKLDLLSELQSRGQTVVMVGDGINDAPVLSAADASIAIDAGTALARASADAVALGRRLGSVVDAVVIAAGTKRVIRQNITWAIFYNVTAVPLAASGVLAPWMAAIGMSVSSLVVVANALRLQRTELSASRSGTGQGAGKVMQVEEEALV